MSSRRHRLASARRMAGHSQESLAERLGVERSTVQRWETGETTPRAWYRPKLARLLQVSDGQLDQLLAAGPDGEQGLRSSKGRTITPEVASPSTVADPGVPTDMFVPVNLYGRTVLVPRAGSVDLPDSNAMNSLTRRAALGFGLAAMASSALMPDTTQALPGGLPLAAFADPPAGGWATAIHQAVLNPMEAVRHAATPADDQRDRQGMRPAVNHAMRVSLTSDYGALGTTLPTLIGRAEVAITDGRGDDRAAYQVLSDIYAVAGWTLIKADNPIGAWIAAQRAVQAAEHAEDAHRLAAATRCLAEVHMRAGSFEEATRTAFLATVHLESTSANDRQTMLALRGAALLSAAAASARRGDSREAYAALKAAAFCSNELGQERSDLATVFGPTNIAIHRVAVAIELGDADQAIQHIPAVQLEQIPAAFGERRSRFLIDVARSYSEVGDDGAAIDALLQAETIAPDELRYHRLTRALMAHLMSREQRGSMLRGLAARCNLLD